MKGGTGIKNQDLLSTLAASGSQKCPFGYPERFFAAVMFAGTAPDEIELDDETRLLLYALFQQTTEGSNTTSRPWGPFVSSLEQAKWDAWQHCGKMPATESSRLYVVTLENACPQWWQLLSEGNKPAKVAWVRQEVREMTVLFNEKAENERDAKEVKDLAVKLDKMTNKAQLKILDQTLDIVSTTQEISDADKEKLAADLTEEFTKSIIPVAEDTSKLNMRRQGKAPMPDQTFKAKLDEEVARLEELLRRNSEQLDTVPTKWYAKPGEKEGSFEPPPPLADLKPSLEEPMSSERIDSVKKYTHNRMYLLGLDKSAPVKMAPFKGSLPAYRMKAVVKPGDKLAMDTTKESSKSKSNPPPAAAQGFSMGSWFGFKASEEEQKTAAGEKAMEAVPEAGGEVNSKELDELDVSMAETQQMEEREKTLAKMVDQVEGKMKLKVVEQMFKEKFGHGRDMVDELGSNLEKSIAAELARRRELASKKVEEEVTQRMILKRKNEELEKQRRAEQKLAEEREMLEKLADDVKVLDAKWEQEQALLESTDMVPQLQAKATSGDLDGESEKNLNEYLGFQQKMEELQMKRGVLEEVDDDDEEEENINTPLLVRDYFNATWHVQDKQTMFNLAAVPTRDVWTMPEVGGETPVARHEHAAAVMDKMMLVIGGRRSGRLMGDVAVLNLESLKWFTMTTCGAEDECFPPSAGHQAVAINGKVLVLGGLGKGSEGDGDIAMHILDVKRSKWSIPPRPPGLKKMPTARAGFAMCRAGKNVWIFGGEDKNRTVLDEVWYFDTETCTWCLPEIKGGKQPPALAYHTAISYQSRYILMFGGMDANGSCCGELFVFDTVKRFWLSPSVMGTPPFPRAGHSAALLGHRMYIVGGGDGCRAVTETQCLHVASLGDGVLKWEPVTDSTVKVMKPLTGQGVDVVDSPFSSSRSPLSSEGLSCVAVGSVRGGSLLAFGGSDGNFYNELLVLNPSSVEHSNTLDSAKADYIGAPLSKWLTMKDQDECTRSGIIARFKGALQ
mmetsp:Transcript_19708/g.43072  ORF Transcript_19708/g.43072 Transcript_19708/m.43072 type:complete len:1013 (-) Transcript_19708:234-3272(-)